MRKSPGGSDTNDRGPSGRQGSSGPSPPSVAPTCAKRTRVPRDARHREKDEWSLQSIAASQPAHAPGLPQALAFPAAFSLATRSRGASARKPRLSPTIAFATAASHGELVLRRPSASRAARRASSDDTGPLTPALLLRQERGRQARADAGFRSGRQPAGRGFCRLRRSLRHAKRQSAVRKVRRRVMVHLHIHLDVRASCNDGLDQIAPLVLSPRSKRARAGRGTTALTLAPARAGLLQRHALSCLSRARRTTASPRGSASRSARARRHPPRYCSRRPWDYWFARNAIVSRQGSGRVLSLWDQPTSQLCSGDIGALRRRRCGRSDCPRKGLPTR